MSVKTCTKCKKEKPLTSFRSRGGSQRHLLKSRCNDCLRDQHRDWCKANPERVRVYRGREDVLHRRCKRRDIEPQQLFDAFDEQKGKCKICPKSITIEDSAIDHNHATGEFRGLLCKNCNRALGLFQDSPTILSNAAAYLLTEGHYGEAQNTEVA
jgi:hypothetical protein